MIRYKNWLIGSLGIIFLLLILIMPKTSWSDKQISLTSDGSPFLDVKTSGYQLMEEDFYLYLQNNIPSSHNHKYMLSPAFKRANAIPFSELVFGESPLWCNQHFVDAE